ncbi:TetR/AcrR family transcriptional regulator [Dactylosporangium vinaceum]|uniref:Helix-turn-helix domain-containing protein n=1 Tax=Dactylosporangium vinaceum TaxID=53362 RepID=A0ABV5MEA7_9ACTN|nr:TetR/AcrR family transcriptional regulator [Dactylosporangium vinaceum]UAB92455.1 TetR/AcrR family transcriptional regulator [Dactylosporangium vinaceum]
MARWEGDTQGRLERAALELFQEQGYDRTTVAQIAQRAGLTERSFYRWFADKREVLFGGRTDLESHLVRAVAAVPPGTAALPTLLAALATVPQVIRPREFLLVRTAVIAANPPLRERELIKLAALAEALTTALVDRGIDAQTARLATDLALAVLRLTGQRCLADESADFHATLARSAADLAAVAASTAGPASIAGPAVAASAEAARP